MKKLIFIIIATLIFVVVACVADKKEGFYNLKETSTSESFKNFEYRFRDTDYTNNSALSVTSKGIQITGTEQHPPAIELSDTALNAEGKKWVILTMSSSAGPFGGFYFKNSKGEEQYFVFPVISDQKIRSYNISLGDESIPKKNLVSKFKGKIDKFAILPTFERNSSAQIESVEFSNTSSGKGFFVPEYCGAFHSLYRVGRPAAVAVRFRNLGGTALTGISAKLVADEGLRQHNDFRDIPVSLNPFETTTLYVDVLPLSPGEKNFKVIITSKEGENLEIPGKLNIETSFADVQKAAEITDNGYIPDPRPISVPDYDIGMYYFTGWSHLNHWPSLVGYAERKPELGFYDESSPVGADWTIKWATEHGVEFINVLLYWRDHSPWNNKFLDEGLMKAKFLPYIKFYVTWSNDLGNKINDDDFLNFYKFVIDQYFASPSYKKSADGRHMVGIFSVSKMTAALTMPKLESLKQQVNKYAVSKGYKGIFWVGGDQGSSKYKVNGFEGFTYYNYPMGGANGYPCSNAKHLIDAQPVPWPGLVADDCVTIIPTTTGFDHRPWYGKMITWGQRYNFTPALFEQNLRDAKSFLDSINQKTIVIESWNEWGEGSSLGPHGLFGLSLLDVIPKVFAPDEKARPHVVPGDVDVYAPEIQGLWDVPGVVKPDYGDNMTEIYPKYPN